MDTTEMGKLQVPGEPGQLSEIMFQNVKSLSDRVLSWNIQSQVQPSVPLIKEGKTKQKQKQTPFKTLFPSSKSCRNTWQKVLLWIPMSQYLRRFPPCGAKRLGVSVVLSETSILDTGPLRYRSTGMGWQTEAKQWGPVLLLMPAGPAPSQWQSKQEWQWGTPIPS